MKKLSFCVFADYHYWPGRYPHDLTGMKTILEDAHARGSQCIIECGDFVHNAPGMPEMVQLYKHNPYGIPAFTCIGNHELEAADSLDEVLKSLEMENNYEYHDFMGFRLIALDTNYYPEEDGAIVHNPPHSTGGRFKPHECMPPEELDWLERVIAESSNPCILFSHSTFEVDNGCVQAREVREIINRANRLHPGRVLMCLNGHYHRNHIASLDGIVYMDVNTVYNGAWFWKKHNAYPEELSKKADLANNVMIFKDPMHAFVTVREDGAVDVEGMESGYIYDITPESLGLETVNRMGRRTEPRISSFHQDAVWNIK